MGLGCPERAEVGSSVSEVLAAFWASLATMWRNHDDPALRLGRRSPRFLSTRFLLSTAHHHLIRSIIAQFSDKKVNPRLRVDVVFVDDIVAAKLRVAKTGITAAH